MALSILCPPLPGEHLYSVAARTWAITTGLTVGGFARAFTGSSSQQMDLGVGFVGAQAGFVEDYAPFLKCTVGRFLTSFLNPPLYREEIHQAVLAGDRARAVKLLGHAGGRRLSLPFFRYCPTCAAAQKTEYGEAYWQVLPQIRGFTHCPEHGCEYLETSVRRQGWRHRVNVGLVRLKSVASQIIPQLPQRPESKVGVDLSNLGLKLLDYRPIWDTGRLDRAWWRLLRGAGYRRGSHGVVQGLCAALEAKYDERYLEWCGCGIAKDPKDSWVAEFIRAPGRQADPLRHLLFLCLLGHDLKDLEEGAHIFLSHPEIDKKTAVCLNPICGSFHKSSVKQTRIFAHSYTRKEMAHFTCSQCDQIIERSLEPGDKVKYRIVERGFLWEDELRLLWGKTGLSVRQIASRLGIESLTAKRHAVALDLPIPRVGPRISRVIPVWARKVVTDDDKAKLRDSKRGAWQEALAKKRTITETKKAARSIYFWLYRNDRDWLTANLPPKVRRKSPVSIVNWKQREKTFIALMPAARDDLLQRQPAVLCTETALLREVGAYAQTARLGKMPRLKAMLSAMAETRISFALRRLQQAKARLPAGATASALFIEAKLKSDLWRSKEIRQYLGV